jgi:hypothetical protein
MCVCMYILNQGRYVGGLKVSNVDSWIDSIVRDVSEIPDRNSPDDNPDMMLVTEKELRDIISDHCIEIGLEIE